MPAGSRILAFAIDGHWPAMHFARLMHIVVRFYRLEELVALARSGGPNLFADRFDPIALKHLAAFDWVAASLMSSRFNDSYIRSEEFVAELGLSDPTVAEIAYGSPGQGDGRIAFAGNPAVLGTMHETLAEVVRLGTPEDATAGDGRGRLNALEAMYEVNLKAKAEMMKDAGYNLAELHAIVSPSLEDLQFLSNAAVQGRITGVERGGVG